ncbi:unnamed protein product [Brassicogethes aeneus]|uniref:Indole-3-acetaldehyde oxidase n=1 Tax=Brassicogethes aeneus TaxID=1431903 RepID=A0A9P0FEJ6_BRAAE|nr:unnamed protein product [Brassicogethes aeneus]
MSKNFGKQKLQFHLGDKLHTVSPRDISPETTLNQYLREHAFLTGTKRMCLEGGCGACIVTAEFTDQITNQLKVIAVNSCLVSLYSLHDWKIYTIEGIGNKKVGFHAIQKALAEGNGTQCGYCSPGMVMNMYSLVQAGGKLTEERIEDSFAGNICRCTGYRPILESFKKFATTDIEDLTPCKLNRVTNKKSLHFSNETSKWIKVYNLEDLIEKLSGTTETYMLVAGNTAKGVYKETPKVFTYIDILSVKELITWKHADNELVLGANVSLSDTKKIFEELSKENIKFRYLQKIADHLNKVANLPVRNIGTLAGNLMIKYHKNEFPSDVFLILETVAATLVIVDTMGNEERVSPKKFLDLDMNKKIIKNIVLVGYDEIYKYESYKIMKRAQNTHANVNAGFHFGMNKNIVKSCTMVYGSINPHFVHATNTENYLKNKNLFDNKVLQESFKILSEELKAVDEPPEPSPEYRRDLAVALFYKFVLSLAPEYLLSSKTKSGGSLLERPLSKGSQEYSTKKNMYPVSQPIIKLDALDQTSGRAQYIEDMPDLPDQLFAQFVVAKSPAGSLIQNIDPTEALKHPGVVHFFGKEDIPGKNNWTPLTASLIFLTPEELFCSEKVLYYDQPVGLIVAQSQSIADKAADSVQVKCKLPGTKPLLKIRDVLNAPEDVKKQRVTHITDLVPIKKGHDVKKVVKGEYYEDLQYHFTMETQVCNVIPNEDGLDVYAATQWMDVCQMGIANVLGIQQAQINIYVKRLGGAYGAKILRSTFPAAAASLAAYLLQKPVKIRMSIEKTMEILGKRPSCLVTYEVGVNSKGAIQYLDADLYSGYGPSSNEYIIFYFLDAFRSGYDHDTWHYSFNIVNTDVPANCFCRAPGSQEGIASIETIMDHIAYTLSLDPLEVRMVNVNKLSHSKLFNYISDLKSWVDIDKIKKSNAEFNNANRWKKRGISVIPMVWSLTIIGQLPAHVAIFHGDGSVAVSHGGVEMGQGINTKVAQVCAYKLEIPIEKVFVKPNNTNISANAYCTAASLTTEAICYATMKACDILLDRIKPFRNKLIHTPWQLLVAAAFNANIQLNATAHSFPHFPDIINYPIYGAGAIQVEVDILTGQHEITQVDIIEDVGDTMNPLIDVGQLEGAFVMGVGYHTTEEIIYNEKGQLLTNRTWNYTPPSAKDIPQNFNIKFPGNNPNPVGVLHSKAIGEPPLCMAIGVPLAIRNALASARKDADITNPEWYPINGCSTIESTFVNSLNNYDKYML